MFGPKHSSENRTLKIEIFAFQKALPCVPMPCSPQVMHLLAPGILQVLRPHWPQVALKLHALHRRAGSVTHASSSDADEAERVGGDGGPGCAS